jgi:hypothetical protein
MAFDDGLAERIRAHLGDDPGVAERKMFGGLCFLVDGNMCCGIIGSDLMVRVGADAYDAALSEPDAREMTFTGRPMRGLVDVSPDGVAEDADLDRWLERGLTFARSLPPK